MKRNLFKRSVFVVMPY